MTAPTVNAFDSCIPATAANSVGVGPGRQTRRRYARSGQLVRESFRERVHIRLRGTDSHGCTGLEPGDRADVQDAATIAGTHFRQEQTSQLGQRGRIHLNHAEHLGEIGVSERTEIAEPGVVHQHLNSKAGRGYRVEERPRPGWVRVYPPGCMWHPPV